MEGTVKIADFMEHLRVNNLVIVPASVIETDYEAAQKKLLRLNMATYKQIADSGIWGKISKVRVLQIAKAHARDGEIVKIFNVHQVPTKTKIVKPAIIRIAKMRGYNTVEL